MDGDLEQVDFKQLSDQTKMNILLQIAKGIQRLHSYNIVHKDLRLANVLHKNGLKDIKIADFGEACQIGTSRRFYRDAFLL
jgi:serine/threonine protein kinase